MLPRPQQVWHHYAWSWSKRLKNVSKGCDHTLARVLHEVRCVVFLG